MGKRSTWLTWEHIPMEPVREFRYTMQMQKRNTHRTKRSGSQQCFSSGSIKNGKYLYSIEDEGVAVFERDKNGDLTRLNSVDINGMRGCYLATDVDGRYLYVAGYHDGKVTVVHTHKDGRLGSVMDGVFHKGLGSVAERNFRPHVNCVRPTPDNKYLCAVDNGIDQVKIYRINKKKDKLELVDILRCPRESGPRIIRFSDDGRFAYLLFELSNEVKVYSYDGSGKNPEFQLLQSITTLGKRIPMMRSIMQLPVCLFLRTVNIFSVQQQGKIL